MLSQNEDFRVCFIIFLNLEELIAWIKCLNTDVVAPDNSSEKEREDKCGIEEGKGQYFESIGYNVLVWKICFASTPNHSYFCSGTTYSHKKNEHEPRFSFSDHLVISMLFRSWWTKTEGKKAEERIFWFSCSQTTFRRPCKILWHRWKHIISGWCCEENVGIHKAEWSAGMPLPWTLVKSLLQCSNFDVWLKHWW